MADGQNPRYKFGRTDNKELNKIIYQDSENPVEMVIDNVVDNKFFNNWSKVFNLQYKINME